MTYPMYCVSYTSVNAHADRLHESLQTFDIPQQFDSTTRSATLWLRHNSLTLKETPFFKNFANVMMWFRNPFLIFRGWQGQLVGMSTPRKQIKLSSNRFCIKRNLPDIGQKFRNDQHCNKQVNGLQNSQRIWKSDKNLTIMWLEYNWKIFFCVGVSRITSKWKIKKKRQQRIKIFQLIRTLRA